MVEYRDAVKDRTQTTGTGPVTLDGIAPNGYRTVASAHSDGATVHYRIASLDQAQWENGEGVFSASGPTLSRLTVDASSNSGNLVNFSSGIKLVSTGLIAKDIKELDPSVLPAIRPSLNLDFANSQTLDPRITFTRASTATCINSSGVLITAAVNNPRFDFDPVTRACKGLLIEEARTNYALYCRDLTNNVWVKTGCTPLLSQVGVDGNANSASLLTADTNNATCLQSITKSSASAYQAADIKRVAGSGNIYMTMDNGTTWTDVTALINSSAYTRCFIPTQTLANPIIGFKLAAAGDQIAIDFVQNENGAFPTSRILTTSAQVTRAEDIASMTGNNFSSWYRKDEGSFVVNACAVNYSIGDQRLLSIGADSNNNFQLFREYGSRRRWFSGVLAGSTVINNGTTSEWFGNANSKIAFAFKSGDSALVSDGGNIVGFGASLTFSTAFNAMKIGKSYSGGTPFNSTINSIAFYPKRLTNSELQALTA